MLAYLQKTFFGKIFVGIEKYYNESRYTTSWIVWMFQLVFSVSTKCGEKKVFVNNKNCVK